MPAPGRFAAIITAAGSSSRMEGGLKKEYRPLAAGASTTVLAAAVGAFTALAGVETIVVTVPPDPETGEYAARRALGQGLTEHRPEGPRLLFVPGGATRRASVHHALALLAAYTPAWVLIHDGARPWVSRDLIVRVMEAVVRYGAAIPVLPLVETPKEIENAPEEGGILGFVRRPLRRSRIMTAQTPQGFAFPGILRAHEKAAQRELDGHEYTDDAEVWNEFEGPAAAVAGETENRKITFPRDVEPAARTVPQGTAG